MTHALLILGLLLQIPGRPTPAAGPIIVTKPGLQPPAGTPSFVADLGSGILQTVALDPGVKLLPPDATHGYYRVVPSTGVASVAPLHIAYQIMELTRDGTLICSPDPTAK